ncbi:hypothetical protein ACOMHN_037851 [Nucella lapillus]
MEIGSLRSTDARNAPITEETPTRTLQPHYTLYSPTAPTLYSPTTVLLLQPYSTTLYSPTAPTGTLYSNTPTTNLPMEEVCSISHTLSMPKAGPYSTHVLTSPRTTSTVVTFVVVCSRQLQQNPNEDQPSHLPTCAPPGYSSF